MGASKQIHYCLNFCDQRMGAMKQSLYCLNLYDQRMGVAKQSLYCLNLCVEIEEGFGYAFKLEVVLFLTQYIFVMSTIKISTFSENIRIFRIINGIKKIWKRFLSLKS